MKDFIGRKLLEKRINIVLPLISGKLLDIGCGYNKLVRRYGNGIGVDVFDWGDVDYVVEDTSNLPFENSEFDTITIVAALNHIPNRENVLKECNRLLQPKGKLIITMLTPGVSRIWHKLRKRWDEDQHLRGMKENEVYGLTKSQMKELLFNAGFEIVKIKRFMLGLNSLYIAKVKK
jgi:ubiquinone/menaquinone biosynthesis C-methylase UbiE